MKFFYGGLAMVLLAFIFATRGLPSVETSAGKAVQDKAKVMIQEMKVTEDTRRLLLPAKVEPRVASLVTAEAEGFVTTIRRPLGSKVRSGEVVLYIENKDPAFTFAKVPVRAPVSGVVSQLSPALMTKVSRGDKLFVVMNPAEIKVTAEVPSADLPLVQPGTQGTFQQRPDEKEGVTVRVIGVSPLVDPRTGTAPAEMEVVPRKDKGAKLPAIGLIGHAVFELSQGKILMIPESALGYSGGKPTVKVLGADGLVKKKAVELGEQRESQLVVKSGLSPGEKLILRASRAVKEGEAVEVEPEAKSN